MIASRMEQLLGSVLLAGVLVSASLVLFGGSVYVARHGSTVVHYRVFRGEPSDLRSMDGIAGDVRAFSGRGIIQLGLLLLVVLQILRVALTGVLFVFARDRAYVAITALVFVLLVYGFVFER